MILKEFPGPDGLHVGEMAQELAEYEATLQTVQEAMDMAEAVLVQRWLRRAEVAPEAVTKAYRLFIGDPE